MFVLIIKPPRPGRSLELAGRRASKLVSKLFGVVGRDDPGESEERVLKRSMGKWPCSESEEEEIAGVSKAHVAPQEEGFVHWGP